MQVGERVAWLGGWVSGWMDVERTEPIGWVGAMVDVLDPKYRRPMGDDMWRFGVQLLQCWREW